MTEFIDTEKISKLANTPTTTCREIPFYFRAFEMKGFINFVAVHVLKPSVDSNTVVFQRPVQIVCMHADRVCMVHMHAQYAFGG